MAFSSADYISMQSRLQRALAKSTQSNAPKTEQLEIGKGGIQDQIQKYLDSHFPYAWYDRKRTDVPTTSRRGVVDIVGVFYGRAFGVEVKRPGMKPRPEQLGELIWMEKAGASIAVLHSLDEAVEFFSKLKQESKTYESEQSCHSGKSHA
jgi:hypothetical protein